MESFLAQLRCEYTGVRLLRLGPGSEILEHKDYDLHPDSGEARIHVCVQTNQDVGFFLNGARIAMAEGECWYLDVSLPHRVVNGGADARVHLVVDCITNDWLMDILRAGRRHD